MLGAEMPVLILGAMMLGMVILGIWVSINFYKTVPPNQAMIISGWGAADGELPFRIVVGGGTPVLPLLQRLNFLSLEVMAIEVRTNTPMITKNGVPIRMEGVAQVKVRGDKISIATAAEQFLGKANEEVAKIAYEILVGHLRATIGTLTAEDFLQTLDSVTQRVQEVSIADLAKMGLTVVSFTIQEIKDDAGSLEALGRRQTAEAKQSAV